ncbi:MAG: DegQ family serine endoprotease [Zoogloeaceae bacterium]|jgi:serine protease Do|nr:DegQ family serine endoprotease [Zoogloeaceae bacterium]
MKKFLFTLLVFPAVVWAQAAPQTLPDFSGLVVDEGKVVVNISTTQTIRQDARNIFPFDDDDPMAEMFRRFMPPGFPNFPGMPRESERHSLGSGFIVSADGYILTNAHVVDGADEVTVRLTDKREFKADVIGADKRTDVALLKIKAANLPVAKLGDPDKLKVGQWVVAIGSPFGFDNTVTAGIVSAKGRALPQENYVPFIQTDVAVNPGNSGGPLFNMQGEVVGINSQIYSRSGGYMGVSFAIPIDVAMDVQNQLRANGKVSRGQLGVVIQEVTKELADAFGLPEAKGALVSNVQPDSPAAKAGLKDGDVILAFNGKPIGGWSDLPRMVGMSRPGTPATLDVWRKGKRLNVAVVIGEAPADDAVANPHTGSKRPALPGASAPLGLSLAQLNDVQQKKLGVKGGLRVEAVGNDSPSELRRGDVLLAFIAKGVPTELTSSAQLAQLLVPVPKGGNITLLVRRGEVQTFLSFKKPGK